MTLVSVLWKTILWKISLNSQKNNCGRAFFMLQVSRPRHVFTWGFYGGVFCRVFSWDCSKMREVSVIGIFLVRIFLHLDWVLRDTPYLSAFSSNAGKYGLEKLRKSNSYVASSDADWSSHLKFWLVVFNKNKKTNVKQKLFVGEYIKPNSINYYQVSMTMEQFCWIASFRVVVKKEKVV